MKEFKFADGPLQQFKAFEKTLQEAREKEAAEFEEALKNLPKLGDNLKRIEEKLDCIQKSLDKLLNDLCCKSTGADSV